jgi:hypothetical protein
VVYLEVIIQTKQYNITPFVTDNSQIEDVVVAYLEGKLDNREDLVHWYIDESGFRDGD